MYMKIKCPKCNRDITTMKPNVKKVAMKYFCKCGNNVTEQKLNQLLDKIKESQRPIDPEFVDIVNKNFWDLI